MRHFRSILYALVLAPAVWTLCGVGFTQDLTGRARTEQSIEQWTGLLLLILAGAAYAILLLPRLSPAGPALAGLVYLGVSVWALADARSFQRLWSPGVAKEGFDLTLPAYGLAAMLAVPLLCTALSARRWRSHDNAPAGTPPFVRPFALPAHSDTLVMPGVTDLPTGAHETMVLPNRAPAEATQVVSDLTAGDRTQVITAAAPPQPPAATTAPSGAARAATTRTAGTAGTADDDATLVTTPVRDPAGLTSVVGAEEPTAALPEPVPAAFARPAQAAAVTAQIPAPAAQTLAPATKGPVTAAPRLKADAAEAPSPDQASDDRTEVVAQDDGELTQAMGVGEQTQAIGVGEQTQAIGVGEQTQAIRVAEHGEKTQAISPVDPGEQTQVISGLTTGGRPGAGTVQPPGDKTQVISIPRAPGELTTVRRAPARRGAPKSAANLPTVDDDITTVTSGSGKIPAAEPDDEQTRQL